MGKALTVPAKDLEDRKVLAFSLERPKSHTYGIFRNYQGLGGQVDTLISCCDQKKKERVNNSMETKRTVKP